MKELYTEKTIKNKQNRYEHITKRERDIISKHLSAGKRLSYIAKALNRSKSSISEEIKRGWYKGKYVPSIANDRSLAARKKSRAYEARPVSKRKPDGSMAVAFRRCATNVVSFNKGQSQKPTDFAIYLPKDRIRTYFRSNPRGRPDGMLRKHLRPEFRSRFAKYRKFRRLSPDTLI